MENQVFLIPRNSAQGLAERYAIRGEQTTLGRHPSNDIVVALDSISRFHARIDARGDFYILQDLNSSNGTYVNGERTTQIALHHGDAVVFGNVEFDFENEAENISISSSSAASFTGRDIVDIRDDMDEPKPTTQSFLKMEEVQGKAKSEVISSSIGDKPKDQATLVKLNQRLSALYALSELLNQLGESDTEKDVLEKVLDVVFQAVTADRGIVMTRFHSDSEELEVTAVKYRDEPIVPQKVRVSRTILDQVLNQQIAILSRDAQADERFNASESIIAAKVRSAICAPMIVNGKVLGVLFIDTMRTDKPFNQEDLEFVTIVANETGSAISAARMRRDAAHRQRLAAVGETVAGISHSVRNILLLSQGGAELLSRALDKDDLRGAKDSWGVVSRGIEKIGKLVRDMLDYSTNTKPSLVQIDINDLICDTAETIEEELLKKSVTLELDLDEDIGERWLDESGLSQTLENLIVNSIQAITHGEGEIVITTEKRADGSLSITLKDNGGGIPEDKLEKIFFPFFTTKGSNGTGLGLPMCKKVIEEMGGELEVESEENIGTKFKIIIPLLDEPNDDDDDDDEG